MIILLTGNDTYTLNQKLKEIRQKFVREVDASNLNSVAITAEELTSGVLKREFSTMPFLAKRRMVILKQCWSAIQKQPALSQEWQDVQTAASLTTPDSPIIVLVEPATQTPAKKMAARKRPVSKKSTTTPTELPSQTMRIECWVNNQNDLIRFATQQAALRGLQFDRSALEFLAQLPLDTWGTVNLLETLAHCPRESALLTSQDLNRWSEIATDDTLFALQDALATANRKQFLKELTRKLSAGVHPLVVLSALQKTIGLLTQALSNSLPSTTHPFVIKKITSQARGWKQQKLNAIAKILFWCDGAMKSSSMIPAETLLTRIGFTL